MFNAPVKALVCAEKSAGARKGRVLADMRFSVNDAAWRCSNTKLCAPTLCINMIGCVQMCWTGIR